jgi:hypothetical protein
MKLSFYSTQELNEIATELFKSEGNSITCEVGHSEILECDAVDIYENSVLIKTVPVQDLLGKLGEHLQITITHFDVIEVGDFGIGFAFFI